MEEHRETIYKEIEERAAELTLYIERLRSAVPGSDKERWLLAESGNACFRVYEAVDSIISATYKKTSPDILRAENALHAEYAIDEKEMTVRIEFDGRLPSRKVMTAGRESYRRPVFNTMLSRTLSYVFKEHPGFHYDEKADLLIYQEYKTKAVARDHDNTDIKSVIDYLCAGRVIDDSPEYLRLRLDGDITGRNHVSIFLCPVSYLNP